MGILKRVLRPGHLQNQLVEIGMPRGIADHHLKISGFHDILHVHAEERQQAGSHAERDCGAFAGLEPKLLEGFEPGFSCCFAATNQYTPTSLRWRCFPGSFQGEAPRTRLEGLGGDKKPRLFPFEENRSTANAPHGAWFRGNHVELFNKILPPGQPGRRNDPRQALT
jgi:hypothetical protein